MAVLDCKNHTKYTDVKIECLGLPDRFIEHGPMSKLYEIVGLDQKSIEIVIDRNLNYKKC